MREVTGIRLRTLLWLTCVVVPFVGLLPWWLYRQIEAPFVWEGRPGQWLGAWLVLNGIGLGGWCVYLFNVQGRGTPLPLDPPKQFVASGPYRFVRNPMILGLFLILAGETLLYQSLVVAGYFLLAVILIALFVRLVEEPELERRFGASYASYKRQVPRWIPRVPRQRG